MLLFLSEMQLTIVNIIKTDGRKNPSTTLRKKPAVYNVAYYIFRLVCFLLYCTAVVKIVTEICAK